MLPLVAKYLIQKRLASRKRLSQLVRGNLISSIAIIGCLDESNFNTTYSYVRELRERGIKVVDFFVCARNQKAMEDFPAAHKDFVFCPKGISFFGAFTSQELEQALNAKYEIVIDLTNGSSLYADLVMASIKSKLRAGFVSKDRTRFYDFMIDSYKLEFKDALAHLDSYLFNLNRQHSQYE